MQAVLTMGAYAMPVIIPIAAIDLGIDPKAVGFFVSGVYVCAMTLGLASGSLVSRLGPTRLFQLLLALVAAGAGALWFASPWAVILSAVLIGCSSGPMNPAGSHVLARVAGPRIRALVFSIKQCGTPAGGMLAGTLLPILMLAYDWRVAVASIPVFAVVLIVLAPLGALGGRENGSAPSQGHLRDAVSAVKEAMGDPAIRAVTFAGLCLAGCQMALGTYLVVYLWQGVGYTPEQAGLVFATLHVAGIVSRIVCGAIADRYIAARWILVMMAMTLCIALLLIMNLSSAWPVVAVYLVIILAGISGNGWVGLYFAELARLAPSERVAAIAAGSQFVMYAGIVLGPLVFGVMLGTGGSYAAGFGMFAILALACGIYLACVKAERT